MSYEYGRKSYGTSSNGGESSGAAATRTPGKRTRTGMLQMRRAPSSAPVAQTAAGAREVAADSGLRGAGTSLPHLDQIQRSFGAEHDVSHVQAHIGGEATAACDSIGAVAYATGDRVAFREAPDLHTAAHEAAHVLQQSGHVQLYGGGEEAYERHADAVADRVVAGQSATDLLSVAQATGVPNIQLKPVEPAPEGEEFAPDDVRLPAVPIGPAITWHAPMAMQNGRLPANARVDDFDASPLVDMIRFGLYFPDVLRDHDAWAGWAQLYNEWSTPRYWRANLRNEFHQFPLVYETGGVTGALKVEVRIVEIGRGESGHVVVDSSSESGSTAASESSSDASSDTTQWSVAGKASVKGDVGIGEAGGEAGATYGRSHTDTRTTGRQDGVTVGSGGVRSGAAENGVLFPVTVELRLDLKLKVKGRPHIDKKTVKTRATVIVPARDCFIG